MRVRELAALFNAAWEGDGELEIRRVAGLGDAVEGDVSFVTAGRGAQAAPGSRASCLLVRPDYALGGEHTLIRVADPRAAIARAITLLHPKAEPEAGVHPTAVIGAGAMVDPGAQVG